MLSAFTFSPLTPASFVDRAAAAFGDRTAIVDGAFRVTYSEFRERCLRLGAAMVADGIKPGDRVGVLCSNSHVMLELHQAVPALGAVLVPVNIRLAADEMRYILSHSGVRLLVATREFSERARELASDLGISLRIESDPEIGYEGWLEASRGGIAAAHQVDERELLAINYTSGTTGRPKGVMYHHRGAYLQALAMAYHTQLRPGSAYLWTLPMFHCNGWTFTWAVTAAGARHVCLRGIDVDRIWQLLAEESITHFSAAPTVLAMIGEASSANKLEARVHVDTGGAPPSPALLARMDQLGFDVTHLYGLTETFGPIAINDWQPEWDQLPTGPQARLRARQGVGNIAALPLRVLDAEGIDVPADATTMGEIAVCGNNVMLGYYNDQAATDAVTRSGCLLTGDIGVRYPDGYLEIRDRSKDVIISGGENIASIEIEQAIDAHPDVIESAVVGAADSKWGEVPIAFVTRRTGSDLDGPGLIAFVRERLAGFKVPRTIVFTDLPRTATGKTRKNVLRERASTERALCPPAQSTPQAGS